MKAPQFVLALSIVACAAAAPGQSLQIGIIDFYALGRLSEGGVRQALRFKEGDTISFAGDQRPAFLAESERRLEKLPGVKRASVNPVCCDADRVIVYVGLEQNGQQHLHVRPAPKGHAELAADLVQAGKDFDDAFAAAMRRGDLAEDDSQGHALFHDPATRAIQERFVGYAARDLMQLRRVVRDSSNAEQRALAAQILGYAAVKPNVVGDLVYAMRDPSPDVRNNAMRALAVFKAMSPSSGQPPVLIPYDPFIELLNSSVWTDRNKASLALMRLSESRDATLLDQLRRQAMTSLIEMARWKSEGHAMPALLILGRIVGESDENVQAAWDHGERERIIRAALDRR
jgi:hypothetical protein